MNCARCGRQFEGGERRFGTSVGWVCWPCIRKLMRQPQGMCWGGCGQRVDLRGKLVDVVAVEGRIVGRYVHLECLSSY